MSIKTELYKLLFAIFKDRLIRIKGGRGWIIPDENSRNMMIVKIAEALIDRGFVVEDELERGINLEARLTKILLYPKAQKIQSKQKLAEFIAHHLKNKT